MTTRKFDRFGFKTQAVVTHGNNTFEGAISDMSLKGLFLETDYPLSVEDTVQVKVTLSGEDSAFSFTIPATVVRTAENGVGLSFKQIDVDSLVLERFREACSTNGHGDGGRDAQAGNA